MEDSKILILRACGLDDEKEECDNIKSQAELYDIDVHDYCPKTNEELIAFIDKGIEFDYIYLSSHGDNRGFANEKGTINFKWFDFGGLLCESACMKEDCLILLSCCRAGLNQVAYDLFFCCANISYIVGPRQSLFPHDMLIAFNIFLYNVEHRGIDPIVACEKVKLGTDIRFVCFDRLETETEFAFMKHIEKYNEEDVLKLNEAKENAHVVDP